MSFLMFYAVRFNDSIFNSSDNLNHSTDGINRLA